jgi:hypothetical protein
VQKNIFTINQWQEMARHAGILTTRVDEAGDGSLPITYGSIDHVDVLRMSSIAIRSLVLWEKDTSYPVPRKAILNSLPPSYKVHGQEDLDRVTAAGPLYWKPDRYS